MFPTVEVLFTNLCNTENRGEGWKRILDTFLVHNKNKTVSKSTSTFSIPETVLRDFILV